MKFVVEEKSVGEEGVLALCVGGSTHKCFVLEGRDLEGFIALVKERGLTTLAEIKLEGANHGVDIVPRGVLWVVE